MPLKGTPREQKHYRQIRKEYPEKGKEYAARVARNIVRANTPEGRKLKGTTEYGRTWGPPYSEPLSKQSVYNDGCQFAMEQLGLKKEAQAVTRLLKGPYGDLLVRLPLRAGGGAGAGAIMAPLIDQDPTTGALVGGTAGLLRGVSLLGGPGLKQKLLELAERRGL